MSNKVNIIVNGKPAGQQSIPGSMQTPDQVPPSTTTSRVLVNGVPVQENIYPAPTQAKPVDEFPPLPTNIQQMVDGKTGAVDMRFEQNFDNGDSFSLAENYLQWQNLKQNHALDKMFLASTPDALMHLHTLHKYIGEVLNLDKKVPNGVPERQDDGPEEDDNQKGTDDLDYADKLASRLASKTAKLKKDGAQKRKPGPRPKDV